MAALGLGIGIDAIPYGNPRRGGGGARRQSQRRYACREYCPWSHGLILFRPGWWKRWNEGFLSRAPPACGTPVRITWSIVAQWRWRNPTRSKLICAQCNKK
jgi:hypothetical protein